MTVGSRVRRLRVMEGWSLGDLSRRSGVTTSNIWSIENQRVYPTAKTVSKICKCFNMNLSEFFIGVEIQD